jgi:hypothetical protein
MEGKENGEMTRRRGGDELILLSFLIAVTK